MKKLIAVILVTSMCLLSACSASPPSNSEPEILSSETENPPSQVVSPQGIAGSHITDIRMGLSQNFGVPEGSIKGAAEEAKSVYAYSSSSSYIDPDTQYTLDYSLTSDSDFAVIGGSFGIENSYNSTDANFQNAAVSYLSFCATMPYNTQSPSEDMKQWVKDNIGTAPKEGVSLEAGDAVWTLYSSQSVGGVTGSYWLEVRVIE